jgi:hypothetical protein
VLWNRTDGDVQARLSNFRVLVLNEKREPVWQREIKDPPKPNAELALSGAREVNFESAYADYSQRDFAAANVLNNSDSKNKGWAVAPQLGTPHTLTLAPNAPVVAAAGAKVTVVIEQLSKYEYATVAQLRLSSSPDLRAAEFARISPPLLAVVRTDPEQRTASQREELGRYYVSIAPALKAERNELASLKKQLEELSHTRRFRLCEAGW